MIPCAEGRTDRTPVVEQASRWGARLDRQFEFVKTQWINDGVFFGSPDDKDPLVGPNDGAASSPSPNGPSAAA